MNMKQAVRCTAGAGSAVGACAVGHARSKPPRARSVAPRPLPRRWVAARCEGGEEGMVETTSWDEGEAGAPREVGSSPFEPARAASDAAPSSSQQRSAPLADSTGEIEAGGFPDGWRDWLAFMEACHEAGVRVDEIEAQIAEAAAQERYEDALGLKRAKEEVLASHPDTLARASDSVASLIAADRFAEAAAVRDGALTHLPGWWVGTCDTGGAEGGSISQDPYGHVVRVSACHGRHEATGYSAQDVVEMFGQPPRWRANTKAGKTGEAAGAAGEEGDHGETLWEVFVRGSSPEGGSEGGPLESMLATYTLVADSSSSLAEVIEMDEQGNLTLEGGSNLDLADAESSEAVGLGLIERLTLAQRQRRAASLEKEGSSEEGSLGAVEAGEGEEEEGASGEKEKDILRRSDEDPAMLSAAVAGSGDPLKEVHAGVLSAMLGSGHVDTPRAVEQLSEELRPGTIVRNGLDEFTVTWKHPRLEYREDEDPPLAEALLDGASAAPGVDLDPSDIETLLGEAPTVYEEIVQALKQMVRSATVGSKGAAEEQDRIRGEVAGKVAAEKMRRAERADQDRDPIAELHALAEEEASARDEEREAEGEVVSVTYRRLGREMLGRKSDPFTGVYYGNFGMHGMELLHVCREARPCEDGSIREHMVVRKLTGDSHVPAGQANFKAAIGTRDRLPLSFSDADSGIGTYPDDLGVTARYAGKGLVAEEGFEEAQWVDGEVLELAGSSRLGNGAPLGLVWSEPGQRKVIVLLQRVHLPVD